MRFFSYICKKWAVPYKIAKDTIDGVIEDNVTRLSASLAFATLFSIIPFFSLLVTIGAWFDVDLTSQLYVYLEPVVSKEVIYVGHRECQAYARVVAHRDSEHLRVHIRCNHCVCGNTRVAQPDMGHKGCA